MPFETVVSIHGVPRSGTSWLGEIFNSHPRVSYRFQPLFSYAFRDQLSLPCTEEEVNVFLEDLWKTQDDFVLQRNGKALGQRLMFRKEEENVLVMKHVRFHQFAEVFLQIPNLKMIYIVRHPCGVIHSWLNSAERDIQWPISEWRNASIKNALGPEEWNGFQKWKEALHFFHKLRNCFPEQLCICSYEKLVTDRQSETAKLFKFVFGDHRLPPQTQHFLEASHHRPNPGDAYSVFQTMEMTIRWETELDGAIQAEILSELACMTEWSFH